MAVISAAVALIAACSDEPSEPEGDGVLGEWVRSGDLVRTYELRLPPSYQEGEPAPLLLAFHGNPDNGAAFEARTGLTSATEQAGFVTVYPDGIEGTWGPWDVQLARDLVRQLSDSLSIDPDRIYITGYSAGGVTAQLIICSLSDVFAAAVSVAATLERDIHTSCSLSRPVPILFVHGTEDEAFPWEGLTLGVRRRYSVEETLDRWKGLNGCQGDAVVDSLPDLVDDGTRVWTERWTDCPGGSEVMLYGIEGGGHTWPSGPGPFPPGLITQEISSKEIVEFLARFTL